MKLFAKLAKFGNDSAIIFGESLKSIKKGLDFTKIFNQSVTEMFFIFVFK